MDRNSGIVWLNGELTDYERAKVSLEDRGFYFGDGVYEVIRAYNGKPFALERHLARLERSAAGIELPLPKPSGELSILVKQLVDQSAIPDAEVYIQITRGAGRRIRPTSGNPEHNKTVQMQVIRQLLYVISKIRNCAARMEIRKP